MPLLAGGTLWCKCDKICHMPSLVVSHLWLIFWKCWLIDIYPRRRGMQADLRSRRREHDILPFTYWNQLAVGEIASSMWGKDMSVPEYHIALGAIKTTKITAWGLNVIHYCCWWWWAWGFHKTHVFLLLLQISFCCWKTNPAMSIAMMKNLWLKYLHTHDRFWWTNCGRLPCGNIGRLAGGVSLKGDLEMQLE